jgi:ABC-type glutathione transport system ATPase component
LSEGEQKVIAIADFFAEMQLSEVNRGIIFDDPVNSLDETRKSKIAKRLVEQGASKQIIIYTHDLVFVSSLIGHCSDLNINHNCHWIENRDGKPGQVWLNNSPSYEKVYRNAEPAKKHYAQAKKDACPPMQREFLLKSGFTALRTCYEVLVINDLFKNVVQRFNERVSVDSLSSVYFDATLIEELQDSFAQCCRYMEGHTHSDKYAYNKPDSTNLNQEILRYEAIRTKIRKTKQPS